MERARRSDEAPRRAGAARQAARSCSGARAARSSARSRRRGGVRSRARSTAPAPVREAAAAACRAPPRDRRRAGGGSKRAAQREFIWPAKGKVLAGFAEPRSKGIDIDGKLGDPIVAAAAGRVTYIGNGIPGLGKLVVIKHDNGFITVYAHNQRHPGEGAAGVTRGQKIAELGATDADRPKLHFQIRKGSAAVDPMRYLPGS